jgi:biopolymer transport protein ExbB/TolQ
MSFLQKGGFFMLPLLICSILMVAVILERWLVFAKTLKTPLFEQEKPSVIVKQLRSHMMILYTVIVISPMLGLLGTVSGLMKCFHLLGETAASAINPQVMSLGISEALITTAAGLIIAVITTIFYNYFTTRLDEYILDYNYMLKEGSRDE